MARPINGTNAHNPYAALRAATDSPRIAVRIILCIHRTNIDPQTRVYRSGHRIVTPAKVGIAHMRSTFPARSGRIVRAL